MDNEIWELVKNQSDDYEFDWLAIDVLGQIAIFSSFNRGYTPECVTKSKELYLELKKIIEELDTNIVTVKTTKFTAIFDDWENYSKKGLFSYDYQDVHRINKLNQYDILFKPQNPITTNHINLKKHFSIIPQFDLKFGTTLSFESMKKTLI